MQPRARAPEHDARPVALAQGYVTQRHLLHLQLAARAHDDERGPALRGVREARLREHLAHDLQVALRVAPAQDERVPRLGDAAAAAHIDLEALQDDLACVVCECAGGY